MSVPCQCQWRCQGSTTTSAVPGPGQCQAQGSARAGARQCQGSARAGAGQCQGNASDSVRAVLGAVPGQGIVRAVPVTVSGQ